MKSINIPLTNEQHKELKQRALDGDTTISALVRGALGLDEVSTSKDSYEENPDYGA